MNPRFERLVARDASADSEFFYAVRTTGVYCVPSCPSRAPRPENVCFFDTAAEARGAGFRACKRCRPEALGSPKSDLGERTPFGPTSNRQSSSGAGTRERDRW